MKANRSAVEQLETRQLLTFSASLVGSTATLTVGATTDSVTFSQTVGGFQHNFLRAPAGQNFADNFDFDSTVAGSQPLANLAGSTVDVQGNSFNATIGGPSSPASSLLTAFNLTGNAGAVTVNDTGDTLRTNGSLIETGANTASLTNIAPAGINLATGGSSTLSILSGSGNDTQTVDFSGGNPIPNGLTYTGGGGANTLILQGELPGGPFANEVYNATGPGAGTIALDSSTINFSGLSPVIDTTPANNFTFNYVGGLDARINVGVGAIVNGQQTTLISTSSNVMEFEQESYANKANVTINTGPSNDIVGVTGAALLVGSSTTINGQAGTNTLNYDAGGAVVVIAPTGTPGQATITRPGSGPLLVENFQQINVINGQIQGVPVNAPSVSASPSLKGTDGIPLTNIDVATFTPLNPNAQASDFGATINWGDGITTAGTIVPDATNPTLFHVEGSHTYSTSGNFTLAVNVSQHETNTTIIPGVTLTQVTANGVNNNAAVSDASLTATGATLSALSGQPLTQALVADFTYAGGLVALTNFSGAINWGDTTSSAFNSTNITTVGTSTAGTTYRITASHTYPSFGTFPVSVTINSVGGSSAISQGSAVVTDSPITPVVPSPITATEGAAFTGTVATFTDLSSSATAGSFLALITWGDGHVTAGTITTGVAPNTFNISGTNTYAKAGSYSASVSIRDTAIVGGSTATVAVPATVLGAAITQVPGAIVNDVTLLQPFTDVVGAFTSANPFATASDFVATITWGDVGTAPTTGLISQEANGSFTVTGSHTYAVPPPIANPYLVTVTVKELASPFNATLTGDSIVLDALLTAQGTTISAIEGKPDTGALIASVSYAGGASVPTSNFTGTVNWGDGTTSALAPANFTLVAGTSDVSTYLVNATHTFPSQGTFPVTVTINSGSGSSAVAHSSAIVGDALTIAILPPAPVENLAFYNLPIATFTDAGTPDPLAKYSATINWGDGSAIVPGTIVANANGTFNVLSSHKYTLPGVFPLTVTVTNDLSGETSSSLNVTVTPALLNVVGHLNPASDSGESNLDAITNDTRPNFYGTATPGTIITLFAIPVGTSTSIPIGSTVTDGSGAWSITSITLLDGRYTIQAMGTDAAGITRVLDVILPNPLQGPLTIDTVAPKVESALFEPLSGQILISLQDNSTGLDQAMVGNGANYSFVRTSHLPTQAHLKKGSVPLPRNFLVTSLSPTAPSDPTAPEPVVITLNNGEPIRGGSYRFTIVSGGIQDVAGNALDGEFFGFFPSGNNIPGGNFVAELDSVHNTVFAPSPVGSSASPLTPPGTLPAATFIPTVREFVLRNGTETLVLAGPQRLSTKSKHLATTVIHGKSTPQVKLAAKPHASALKAAKHHG